MILKEGIKEHFSWEEDSEKKEEEQDKEPEDEEDNSKEEKKKKEKKEAKKEEETKDDDDEEESDKKSESKKGKKATKNIRKKDNTTKYIVASIIILIVAVSLFIVYKDKIIPNKEASSAVAVVNGETITSAQLDKEYSMFVPAQAKAMTPKGIFLEKSVIPETLLMQEAAKQKIYVGDYEVDAYINDLISRLGITNEEFTAEIENEGFTLNDVKEAYKKKITIAKLMEKVIGSNIIVTDSEIETYYNNNREEFSGKEGEIRASHILVKTEEEAKAIIQELKKGADFGKLAAEISIDPSAVSNKGDLGFFGKGVMVPEFENAAFALQVGQISAPVKTAFGYHVIKREKDILSLAEASDSINQSLFAAKQQSALETYINQLESKADINIISQEGSKQPSVIETLPEEAVEKPAITPVTQEKQLTFKDTGDDICTEDGKPVIRMYSASIDPYSVWVVDPFNEVIMEYEDKVVPHNWDVLSGDDLMSYTVETQLPKAEFDVYKKYNSEGTVPTFVFGCKYVRIGTPYKEKNDLESEKAEFRQVIEKLLA